MLLDIIDALLLTDVDVIEEQCNERRKLARTMVGQLYPSILYDEIVKLNELSSNLRMKQQHGTVIH